DDVDAEADLVREAREMEADVAGADDVQLGRRLDRLDVDVHLSAADQPGLLREVVVELVVDELRPPAADRLARLAKRVVLVAAAADRADDPAVAEHEHLGPDPLRCGTGGRHDRDQRRRLSAFQGVSDGGEDLSVHLCGLYGAWWPGWPGRSGRSGKWGQACGAGQSGRSGWRSTASR